MSMTAFFRTAPLRRSTKPSAASASAGSFAGPASARERQTSAFYMGVGQSESSTQRSIRHGRAATTPFALIENGSRPEQRVSSGALEIGRA
ncbi:hypothetical protein OY671_008846, partial [Metschnikowia pulcherrima]